MALTATKKIVVDNVSALPGLSEISGRLFEISDSLLTPKPSFRLLLVDDDPSFQKLMARAARASDQKLSVCSGPSTIASCLRKPIDAIIMDFCLGETNGVALAARIGESFPEIPVLMVSETKPANVEDWPSSIKLFLPKSGGPKRLLSVAERLAEKTG